MKKVLAGLLILIVVGSVIVLVSMKAKNNKFANLSKGKSYMGRDNGSLIKVIENLNDPQACKSQCEDDKNCGGITYSDVNKRCYLSTAGQYFVDGLPNDYAWVKK